MLQRPTGHELRLAALGGVSGVAGSYAVSGYTPSFVVAPIDALVVSLTPGAVVQFVIENVGSAGHLLHIALSLALAVGLFAGVTLAGLRLVDGAGSRLSGGLLSGLLSWVAATATTGAPLLAVGAAIWLFERKANAEEFGGSPAQGMSSGFWWAAVTMTTVGYGDKAPRTLGGRLVGLVWMFAAVIIISSFTAAIATSLTVGSLSSGIKGVQDLRNAKVVTVGGSAAADSLRERGIAFVTRAELEDGLQDLADERVDAVVYDAPLLRYRVMNNHPGALQVLPAVFDRQDYAFALPQGSELREPINRAILEYLATDEWRDTLVEYLGKRP